MADDAAAIMVEHGALGCAVAEGVSGRTGIARRKFVRLEAYFDGPTIAARTRIRRAAAAVAALTGELTPRVSRIVDPGWATRWQSRFRPFRVGRHFVIVPPWERADSSDGRIPIVIQPGQAFGTGHHGSTCGVLCALEDLCERGNVKRALDVGTGSGILAFAMLKLDVKEVVAIDVDAIALANARENAALNRLGGRVRFSTTPLAAVRGQFDLIAANILTSTLITLAPQLKPRVRHGGRLIL
ncbi:MAG: 50S ribosomal protein L11 methyltransferase, partial [Pseudomonadota bacterium]